MADSFDSSDRIVGYAAMLVSCLGFGTMFVPLRKADCRDGMFVQWVQCSVVFLFGFAINIWRGAALGVFPEFNWIAAIGGVLYATGNCFSVPIVEGIGVGLGMLIWGTIQVLVGWSVARFGVGDILAPSPVKNDAMNYIGMAVTVICGVLFVFVRHASDEDESPTPRSISLVVNSEATTVEMTEVKNYHAVTQSSSKAPPKDGAISRGDVFKKLPFVGMAVCLGILHGLMMTPVDIAKQRVPTSEKADKYYMFNFVFSYYSTVFAFSTLYFFLYCIVRRKRAHVKPSLVVPSMIYGILWSIGMTLWFLSADRLAQTVAYPITTRLPAILGALTDVLVWKTIKGRFNVAYLFGVVILGIVGVVLIALSNSGI